MVINTKFKVGDLIWYMRQNSVVQGIVDQIVVDVKDNHIGILYHGNWVGTQWRFSEFEHSVFGSKQALLASL